MKKTYLIFILQGFDQETETGQLLNVTSVELIDNLPEKALARAKKLINKKFWRFHSVIEKEK